MWVFIFLLVFLLLIITIFTFPKLSSIPYFPSHKKDLPLIIKTFKLVNNQVVFDLGAGDGMIIFEAAKKAFQKGLNTKFIAVEINPILILILNVKSLFNPNRKNIKIVWKDLFKINYKSYIPHNLRCSFYFYASPWLVEKIVKTVKKQGSTANLVSYFYPIKSLIKKQIAQKGVNSVFSYQV